MTLTAEQINQAQQAGNREYARAYGTGKLPADCSDAYRAAYDATAAAIVEALERAASEAGVTAEWLTPQEVAQLEERTSEQSGIVEHYDSHTEGHW